MDGRTEIEVRSFLKQQKTGSCGQPCQPTYWKDIVYKRLFREWFRRVSSYRPFITIVVPIYSLAFPISKVYRIDIVIIWNKITRKIIVYYFWTPLNIRNEVMLLWGLWNLFLIFFASMWGNFTLPPRLERLYNYLLFGNLAPKFSWVDFLLRCLRSHWYPSRLDSALGGWNCLLGPPYMSYLALLMFCCDIECKVYFCIAPGESSTYRGHYRSTLLRSMLTDGH